MPDFNSCSNEQIVIDSTKPINRINNETENYIFYGLGIIALLILLKK
jgi:hypothetical protein